MDLGITGRTALVAGGSKGIGKAAALILAGEKCRLAIVARDQEAIDLAVAECRALGAEAVGVSADLTSQEGVEKAVQATREAFAAPDIVVSQTNDMQHGAFWELKPEKFDEVFRTYTMSQVYMVHAVLPHMRRQKWGRFVHIGSGVAKEPETRFPHILANVARPSTQGLFKTLVDEVASDGVTINTVAPGWTLTPALEAHFADRGMTLEEGNAWLRSVVGIPAGRAGTAKEVASMVAFLCSEQAGYVNGELITVNGGIHRSLV